MKRLWVTEKIDISNHMVLDIENLRHMKALRLYEGDTFILMNGDGYDYTSLIKTMDKREVLVEILRQSPNLNENQGKIYLFQSVIKTAPMDLIIQKAVELGVYQIIPMNTNHSVALDKNMTHKLKRWENIMIEACKQSQRAILPSILPVQTLENAISISEDIDMVLVADEKEEKNRLLPHEKPRSIGFFIGPEGGWSVEERALFAEEKIESISLGKRILRGETAAIYVLSLANIWESSLFR